MRYTPQSSEDYRRMFFENRDAENVIADFKEYLIEGTELSTDFLQNKRQRVGIFEMYLESLFLEYIREVHRREEFN